MPRQPQSTPEADLRRATLLLGGIYLVTAVGMIVIPLLTIKTISTGIWIALVLLTVIFGGAWWFYKRQIDAEIRENAEKRQQKKR